MVCSRFVMLSVGTLLALLSMIDFSAYAQDTEVPLAEESALYGQEESLAIAIAGLREINLRGRKMGGHEDLGSEINGKESLKEGSSSLISGANHRCNRRCDNQEKRNFNVTDEVGDENSSARKCYKPKFVLFSVYGPKQHPRKGSDGLEKTLESEDQMNEKSANNMPDTNISKPSTADVPLNKPSHVPERKPKLSSDNSMTETKGLEEDHDSSREDETRRLLEAAKEIVSLMHKDYRGFARRKPPINNHEPSH